MRFPGELESIVGEHDVFFGTTVDLEHFRDVTKMVFTECAAVCSFIHYRFSKPFSRGWENALLRSALL